ncbi:MAG TPA: branched-chain amino acid ABC transporter permease [archaeon]|nr:branched-chain amino acid ABC transporter permease [archaeon]
MTRLGGSIWRSGWPWLGLVMLGLLVYPQLVSRYYIALSTEVVILALLATSYNLIFGYAGMVSFGHAAFFGLGAYAMALLTKTYGFPMLVGLLMAPVVAAAFAFVIGWFCMRTIRLYFSLLTLAFAQLLWVIVFQWYRFTGGSDGIQGVPRPEFLASYASYYYFTLAVMILCMLLMWFIVNSPFGWSLRAIRENTQRSQFLGINDRFYKLIAFTMAGAFAGVAGGLYCQFQKWADPDLLFWTTSANPVLMSILGGMFNFVGPSIGAVLFVGLREIVKVRTDYWPLVLGLVLLTLVLLVPGGIVGFAVDKVRALVSHPKQETARP